MSQLPAPKTHEKADIFLTSLAKQFPTPGDALQVQPDRNYPLACAASGGELKFYLRALRDRGFIEGEGNAHITLSGWERISQLETAPVQVEAGIRCVQVLA